MPRGGNGPPNEEQFNRLAPKLAHNYLDEYFHTSHKGSLSRYRPGHFLFDSEPDKNLFYDRDTATQRCCVRLEPCGEVFLASQYLRYFISRLSVSHLLYPLLGRRRVGRFHADSGCVITSRWSRVFSVDETELLAVQFFYQIQLFSVVLATE